MDTSTTAMSTTAVTDPLAPIRTHHYDAMSPECSTDLTNLEVRPPIFLHGFRSIETIPTHTANARTATGGTLAQPFPHAA